MESKAYKPDGTLMASQSNTWEDMEYEDLVTLEGALVEFQKALNNLGVEEAKKKKEKKSEV
jgi:hypothetical protein